MTASKGKDKLTIYINFELSQSVKHLAVQEDTTASVIIEKLIKKAIEQEKVKKV